jgi:hypothetical protein
MRITIVIWLQKNIDCRNSSSLSLCLRCPCIFVVPVSSFSLCLRFPCLRCNRVFVFPVFVVTVYSFSLSSLSLCLRFPLSSFSMCLRCPCFRFHCVFVFPVSSLSLYLLFPCVFVAPCLRFPLSSLSPCLRFPRVFVVPVSSLSLCLRCSCVFVVPVFPVAVYVTIHHPWWRPARSLVTILAALFCLLWSLRNHYTELCGSQSWVGSDGLKFLSLSAIVHRFCSSYRRIYIRTYVYI